MQGNKSSAHIKLSRTGCNYHIIIQSEQYPASIVRGKLEPRNFKCLVLGIRGNLTIPRILLVC